ncbi:MULTISPECIES: ABC transporter permease subunit [unclassified Methanoculleus]|jgi:ABC-2 type transport system permease protein|uniref:ABC transporter permease subunit n=1 Tax=Methanoculleus palmolei TaxID=72612 RepID=A0ABD8AAE6_9EURY|nr:ABC transporter permease subunit [Methanoculleus sp. UBA377]WOX56502.1 ABC transporter permease subunit [Methanoculleus palmolei]
MATEPMATGEARERRGMKAERVFIVARKEFTDQITGWRFPVILALFLAIALIGTYGGVGSYERDLDRYTEELAAVDDRVDGPERMMPSKPPVADIYSSMFLMLISYGGLLAIAVGFDLVSKEKESRSLKSLLSHPVYRDEIINGKALGGVALLAIVVGGVLLLTTALLLVLSIVPTPGDLWMILTYAGVTLLFLVTFFSIALALSTLCQKSGSALLLAMVVFVLLVFLAPYATAQVGMAFMMEKPDPAAYGGDTSSEGFQAEIAAYTGQMKMVESAINLFSPQMAVNTLINGISSSPGTTLDDTLGRIWSSVVALILYPVAFFAVAYTRFLRMDIR